MWTRTAQETDGAASTQVNLYALDATNHVCRVALDRDGDSYIAATSTDDMLEIVTGGTQRATVSTAALTLAVPVRFDSAATYTTIPATTTTGFGTGTASGAMAVDETTRRVKVRIGTVTHELAHTTDGRGTVSGLTDTLVSSPTEGQGLIWNATNGRWENGTVRRAPPAAGSVDTAALANDAVTKDKMADNAVGAAEIIDNSVGAAELNVVGNGTAGQVLTSDGDGSMSWTAKSAGGGGTPPTAPSRRRRSSTARSRA